MRKNRRLLIGSRFLIAVCLIFTLIILSRAFNHAQYVKANLSLENSAYPIPVLPTNIDNSYPAPLSSPQPPTSDNYHQLMETEYAIATQTTLKLYPAMTATAQAMNSAKPTPGISTTGYCFTDDDKYFSLQLPPGWQSDGYHNIYTIANYTQDQLTAGKVDPAKTLWIQIQTPLPDRKMTIEELLKSWTDLYKEQPTPYHIGRYDGYQFDMDTKDGGGLAIIIPIKGGKFLIFSVNPGSTEMLNEGLSILSTLDDSASCQNKPGAITTPAA